MTDYGEKRCQECNHPVAPELDEKMDSGKTVYCEQCGAQLTESTVIKTKPRRNHSKHTSSRHGKSEPFTGTYSKSKQREKKKLSPNESKQSENALQTNYTQQNSWSKWFISFREFLSKFIKNLRESLGSFSTTLHEEMAKIREESHGKDQKSAQNYPAPIMPKIHSDDISSLQPSPAPIAPASPLFVQSSPQLKTSVKARFDPYTGKPLNSQISKMIPGKRFDPFTGKMLLNSDSIDPLPNKPIKDLSDDDLNEKIVSSQSNILSSDEKGKTSPTTHDFSYFKPKKTYEEVFVVLSVEVRGLLSELEMPESEKASMARTFIYLTEAQQLKYLRELQNLNSPDYSQLNHLIEIIDTLPLPGEQKKILIDQLDYFTDEKSHEFVNVIEREVKKDIERLKSSQKSTINELELNPEGEESEPPKDEKKQRRLLSD